MAPVKNRQFLQFIHNNNNNNNNYHNHQLLQTGFLPSNTEASATLLISLDINFSAIGPCGFSFSVWTKIRPCWAQ